MSMELLVAARRQGVLIYAEGEALRVRAMGQALTPALKEQIKAAKPELLALLGGMQPAGLDNAALQAQEAYWCEALAGAPSLHALPTDHARGAPFRIATLAAAPLLDAGAAAALRALAAQWNTDALHVLQAAFATLVCRWSGAEELVLGSRLPARLQGRAQRSGVFDPVVPLRLAPDFDAPLAALAAAAQGAAVAAHGAADLPLLLVADLLKIERDDSHAPVMQILLLEDAPAQEGGPVMPGAACMPARFDLAAMVQPGADGAIGLAWHYDAALFGPATLAALSNSFARLLEALLEEPGRPLGRLELVSAADWARIDGWNDTDRPFDEQACMQHLFVAQARATPAATALVCGTRRVSYGELHAQARRVAAQLRSRGIGPGATVAVCAGREPELFGALLGVQLAGAAYLPIDPGSPADRIAYMLADSAAPLVLTTSAHEARLPAAGVEPLCVDRLPAGAPEEADEAAVPGKQSDVAYVIYTSGSTGKPKGVAVTHRGVISLRQFQVREFGLSAASRVLQFSSIGFDASVWEWMMALLNGGTLYQCPEALRASADELADYLVEHQITHAFLPPALLTYMDPDRLYDFRMLMVGGESCPDALRHTWAARVQLYNGYGPTEGTMCASWTRVTADEPVTIGSAVDNVRLYVVDRNLQALPVGAVGELLIGGAGLARGYLGKRELTDTAFVDLSLRPGRRERLYRSGDLVRYLENGKLDFIGRVDNQVQLRGFRIEPGEIEAVLAAAHPTGQAVVLVRSAARAASLAAFVTAPELADAAARRQLARELQERLAAALPPYMVPSSLLVVPAFPLTRNGKTDKATLLALDEDSGPGDGPRTPLEEALAAIWRELLRREHVGRDENFFAAGGDSILSIQAVARANQAGIAVTARQFAEIGTIAGIAAIAGTGTGAGAAAAVGAHGEMPLMPIQRRFLEANPPAPHHFNQAILLRPPAGFDPACLPAVAAALVRRHDALRLVFPPVDGERRAVHLDAESIDPAALVAFETMQDEPAFDAFVAARAARHQEAFDLDHGPLLRMVWLSGAGESRLLLLAHHLVVDGVSWRILLQGMHLALRQLETGGAIALPDVSASYQQWSQALAAHAGVFQVELPYWLAQTRGAAPALAPDRAVAEPPLRASTRHASIALTQQETRQLLRQCGRPYRTAVPELLLAALQLGVRAMGGAGPLCVALEGHGREALTDGLDLGRTVGWFTTLFPLRLDAGAADVGAVIRATKEQYRGIPHGGLGYGVLRYLAREPGLAAAAAPQILFNYLGQFDAALDDAAGMAFADEASGAPAAGTQQREFALGINGLVSGGTLQFTIDYSADEFDAATIDRFAAAFLAGLREVVAHCLEAPAMLTPSDFPLARITQPALDALQRRYALARLYPATAMQQGLLFHTLVDGQAYTSQILLELEGPLEPALLRRAWQAVGARHDVFRTAIVDIDEQPHQLVVEAAELPWEEVDLRGLHGAGQEAAYTRLRLAQRAQPFDLAVPPLMRLSLLRMGEQRYRLLWSHHHLLLDGWSLPVIYGDVMAHYGALLEGREPAPAPVRPYQDYVAWLQRQDADAAREYWRAYLAGVEAPTPLSIDRLPAAQDGEARFAEFALSAEATERLQQLARRNNTTLYTVLQYAWGWLLHKYSGEQTVVFGAILSGRPPELAGVEGMVGLFLNTLPVKFTATPGTGVAAALGALQRSLQESAGFGYLPLGEIRRQSALAPGAALFDSVMVLENYPIDPAGAADGGAGLRLCAVDGFEETNYKLTLNATLSDRLAFRCSYRTDVLAGAAVGRMLGHLDAFLTQLPQHDDPSRIAWLSAAERGSIARWATPEAPAQAQCIHARFEAQARRAPDAVALVCGDQRMTYGELDARANRLARALRAHGARRETLVGLSFERGLDMVVAILGTLKAGAAYVPFDPATPASRLDYLLEDSAVGLLLAEPGLAPALAGRAARVLALDEALLAPHGAGALAADADAPDAASAAYVIYTSGSTGRPKGAVVEHRHVDRLMSVTEREFDFGPDDVWTLFHSYAFDFSVWEMWGALCHGGRLVVVPRLVARTPEQFYRLVAQQGVTVLNQTPAAFEQFSQADERERAPLALRYVIFGGAALEFASLRPWMARHSVAPRMINMYGITETTVHVTVREVSHADALQGGGSLIGRPLADLGTLVLDPAGQPVPVGVAGELYVTGAGVCRGYLDRPELTAQRFIDDPAVAGGRRYRTGDLVRRQEDGDLEYLGRIDNQVKIRGFRIELGEIEAQLMRQAAVRQALVLADGDGAARRLVAYVVLDAVLGAGVEQVRAALAEALPDYMVPAVIMQLAAMPLNVNGKIDRAALPAPDAGAGAGGGREPASDSERRIAAIWQEALGLDRVGVDDNFFAVGGDSIRAIPLVARLQRAGFGLGIKDLFEAPTIAALAERAGAAGPIAAAAELAPFALVDADSLAAHGYRPGQAELHDAYPMTALQQGMVFHNMMTPSAYHDVMSFHVRAAWDLGRFESALASLVARHEILRTVFSLAGATPLQLVLAQHTARLEVSDLSALPPAQQDAAVAGLVERERNAAFEPGLPPWQVHIQLRAAGEFQYTLSFHHALMDGWSVANLNTQLFNAYLGDAAAAPARHLPFAYYVQLEQQALRDPAARRYWREHLDGAVLPWWAGKPKRQTLRSVQRLDGAVSARIVALAGTLGVQTRSVLLALHVALMALLDGRADVLTSVVSNGRPEREGGDATLGLFLNSLPFRVAIGDLSWEQLVRKVDAEVTASYGARLLPLVEIQAESRLDFSASLFNYVNFHVYQHLDSQLDVVGAQGAEEKNYSISLSFSKVPGDGAPLFDVSIDVDAGIFDAAFLARIEGYIPAIAAAMTADGNAPAAAAQLLGREERATLAERWTPVAAPYPALPVHEAFAAQARLTPDAPAVRCGGATLSYAELDRRSGALALLLRARGMGPGRRAGLCMENSVELMTGLLAILKSGGAYVPLDPLHPRERLARVAADSALSLVLTQARLAASLAGMPAEVLAIDAPATGAQAAPAAAPVFAGAAPADSAYVIYTSGSTGQPKGVVVSHRALAIYLGHALQSYYAGEGGEAPRGSLVATSFAFDLTKPALFLPLMTGGVVELLHAADPLGALARRIADPDSGNRLVRATPMHMQAMLDLMADAPVEARHAFVIGGDSFTPVLARRLQQRFPRSRIYNHYGPSESVVGCAMYEVTPHLEEIGDIVPVGRAMSNTALYVLDERLQPCPLGVPGMLYVAGEGLADGYLGQPELTARSFVENPLVAYPSGGGPLARMYRTGDRVRYDAAGDLLFLGRADDQVKLRGFRVEPGEIEAALRQLPMVRDAVVAARGSGADTMLVGYLVLSEGAAADPDDVAAQAGAALRLRLPEYMVPGAFVLLDALPLSANGKIDRRRLPEPVRRAATAAVALEGDTEQRLARIWRELLDVAAVGATDSFFELGGHSLKATRMVSAIGAEFGVALPLVTVFGTPRLRGLAEHIDRLCIKEQNRAALAALDTTNEMDW